MILFTADNHFDQHCGKVLHEALSDRFEISFEEDTHRQLADPARMKSADLLILNLIGDTPGSPHAGPDIEGPVRGYLDSGHPLLLLHGASAAFWKWDWWRKMVGLRWVRGDDPDGFTPSTHPVRPYPIRQAKSRHPLVSRMIPFDCPEDEIYIHLEQTRPIWVLLETTIAEGTFPMAYACETHVGGKVFGFLPGHRPEVVSSEPVVENVSILINALLAGK